MLKNGAVNSVASRILVDVLNREFAELNERAQQLAREVPAEQLYTRLGPTSFGESILRSAALVEQTCGGLMSNLWDDPFEWTLPETLDTPEKLIDYLIEVEHTRQKTFSSFKDDRELFKQIMLPSEEYSTVVHLLMRTLTRAAEHLGRAFSSTKSFSRNTMQGYS
jgi:hypothetical protein